MFIEVRWYVSSASVIANEEKGEWIDLSFYCKQRIVQLYFEQKLSYGRIAQVLAAEGLKEDQEDHLDYCFKVQGTQNAISAARKRWTLQAHAQSVGYHRGTGAGGWQDYSYSTGENAKHCRLQRLNKYHYSSLEDSRLDIPWQQILPDDPDAEQRQKDLMDTQQRIQHIWWHHLDGQVDDSARESLDIFVQEGWRNSPGESTSKASGYGVSRYLQKGSYQHLPYQPPSQQHSLPSGALHTPPAFSPRTVTKWQAAARQCSMPCFQGNSRVLQPFAELALIIDNTR